MLVGDHSHIRQIVGGLAMNPRNEVNVKDKAVSILLSRCQQQQAWQKRSKHKKINLNLLKSRARQNFGASLQRCNSTPDWASVLSKSSSDSASLLLEIEKKTIFVFGLRFAGGTAASGGVFAFFGPPLPGPGPQPIGLFFWLKIFLETRPKSASLEPLNDFLAYRERKLRLINQKLTNILLPQKPLWGHFSPGNNSPSDWARELFNPSKDSWRYAVSNKKETFQFRMSGFF